MHESNVINRHGSILNSIRISSPVDRMSTEIFRLVHNQLIASKIEEEEQQQGDLFCLQYISPLSSTDSLSSECQIIRWINC